MIPEIDYNQYWSTVDIMDRLSVSKDWIYHNIRPYMEVKKLAESEENPVAVKAKNTVWYRKDVLFSLFLDNTKVFTRDYYKTTERLRGEEIEIAIPEEIKSAILNGEFTFMNVNGVREKLGRRLSNESIYRFVYKYRAYLVKLFGKTYYYFPGNQWPV